MLVAGSERNEIRSRSALAIHAVTQSRSSIKMLNLANTIVKLLMSQNY